MRRIGPYRGPHPSATAGHTAPGGADQAPAVAREAASQPSAGPVRRNDGATSRRFDVKRVCHLEPGTRFLTMLTRRGGLIRWQYPSFVFAMFDDDGHGFGAELAPEILVLVPSGRTAA